MYYFDIFPFAPTSRRNRNTQAVRDDWQILIVPLTICIIVLELK